MFDSSVCLIGWTCFSTISVKCYGLCFFVCLFAPNLLGFLTQESEMCEIVWGASEDVGGEC